MAELWLVCEGTSTSVDVALLQQVFDQVLAAEIIVKPASGEKSLSPVVQFLNSQGGVTAAFVQDRDYRPREVAEASMKDGKPGFFWRRHTIENYLLPPPIILRAFQGLRERTEHQRSGRVPAWMDGLFADAGEVADALRECAHRRVAEEACRLANFRLWAELPAGVGHVQRDNPKVPGSEEPGDWREALCREAERVCRAATQTVACESFRRGKVTERFDEVYARITAEDYIRELEFLIDFHGKDLLAAFHQWLKSRRSPLSFKGLCDVLIPAAVHLYAEVRTIYGSDDFRDLANGVRSLAGLAPLP